ncbi:MAG: hypothetical protein RJA70_4257, partial [Pseudomonadota bacterium]
TVAYLTRSLSALDRSKRYRTAAVRTALGVAAAGYALYFGMSTQHQDSQSHAGEARTAAPQRPAIRAPQLPTASAELAPEVVSPVSPVTPTVVAPTPTVSPERNGTQARATAFAPVRPPPPQSSTESNRGLQVSALAQPPARAVSRTDSQELAVPDWDKPPPNYEELQAAPAVALPTKRKLWVE